MQTVALAGAVIVTTPQEVALIDARKASAMFAKVNVPVLGLIENMSYFLCPSDGQRYDIFGSGGGEREAAAAAACRCSGRCRSISRRANGGTAACRSPAAAPASPAAREFAAIAARLAEQINLG